MVILCTYGGQLYSLCGSGHLRPGSEDSEPRRWGEKGKAESQTVPASFRDTPVCMDLT